MKHHPSRADELIDASLSWSREGMIIAAELLLRISRDAVLRRAEKVQDWVCSGRLVIDPDGKLEREVERLVLTIIVERFERGQVAEPV